MKKWMLAFGFFILLVQNALGQENKEINQLINEIFEQYAAETDEQLDYESFYNDLIQLAEQPVNLNTAQREELEKLPFLSDIQIENILAFIYKNGTLNSMYELQLIEGLDMTDIRRLLPFVRIGEKDSKPDKIYINEILRYGKSEFLLRADKTAELKSGFKEKLDDNNQAIIPFAGNSFYNSFKYNFNFRNRIVFGAVFEKDAGEPYWNTKHKGADFNSFHLQVNNIWKFKTVVLGDFRASFGQGLVFNSGYGTSKSSYVLNVNNKASGLKKFSSTDEYNYFRGMGATYQHKKLEFSAFYSSKYIDADTSNLSFSSIYKTGLHRTSNEHNKQRTVQMQTLGLNLQYKFKLARLGFTYAGSALSLLIQPQFQPYNIFYFKGDKLNTFSIDYKLRLWSLNFFGESAYSSNKGYATVNGVHFAPLSTVSLVALWRYYSPSYDTFYANAFAENSRVNNESGIYIGAEVRPFRKWKFSLYTDSYRLPWLKYGVNAPSLGMDYLLSANFEPARTTQMLWRLKYENKQKNGTQSALHNQYNYSKASLRYQLVYSKNRFSTKNIFEISYSDSVQKSMSFGFVATQDVSYQFEKIPLTIDLRCMFFDAPEYDNRFYLYEHDILYAYSIPMVYGLGMRYYLNLKWDVNRKITLWFKVAQTVYDHSQQSIGSGFDEIIGNKKTDFRLLLRYSI